MEKFDDMESCWGCGELLTDSKHCPHCDDASAHETRHDEWRAWLVIGSGVAVALLWWVWSHCK